MRKEDLHPFIPFGYYFCNVKFVLNPFVFAKKTASHQISCKIQVIITVWLLTALFPYAVRATVPMRTVTDQMGREVVVPVDPRRVVSLSPSITENIFAINQEHRLKGVTRFSDFPPKTAKYPKVGSYTRLDIEKIVALKPDLCIGLKDGNPPEVIERLESLNIPVFSTDPRNLEAVLKTILEIGDLLNSTLPSQTLVSSLQSRIKRVKALVTTTPRRPRVFFQIGISPIVSAGNNTFIHELITLAGGINASAGPTPYPRFSREKVLGLAPEVFIITSMARGGGFDEMKAEWSRWPDMPAVRDNRIYLMDSDVLDRATPRMIDGLEILLQHIHPELFE
ncbi:ABC transporter substrate-binding protein [Thermodesulfobacteriota bacterium]